jgi:hypothetical protein
MWNDKKRHVKNRIFIDIVNCEKKFVCHKMMASTDR